MRPSEVRDLAVSMASELDAGASMTGETPEVSAWTESAGVYTEDATFTFASAAVNTAELTTEDGETIAIGEGIAFRCTAPATLGTYYIRSECDADDGTHVVRYDRLDVEGPGAPA
jgi:hypothetical protein